MDRLRSITLRSFVFLKNAEAAKSQKWARAAEMRGTLNEKTALPNCAEKPHDTLLRQKDD
ncbi:MAG: hypothetical protein IJ832_01450 [Bacteroidaceae bacterium]|nr:hypothetical protein [Bacteroidaceae bacterium]